MGAVLVAISWLRSPVFDSPVHPAILSDPAPGLGLPGTKAGFFIRLIANPGVPMGKFKPHKGLLKRIRITKSGRIKCRVANGSHLRSGKSHERLRNMRQGRYVDSYGIRKRVRKLLGRSVSAKRQSPEASEAKA